MANRDELAAALAAVKWPNGQRIGCFSELIDQWVDWRIAKLAAQEAALRGPHKKSVRRLRWWAGILAPVGGVSIAGSRTHVAAFHFLEDHRYAPWTAIPGLALVVAIVLFARASLRVHEFKQQQRVQTMRRVFNEARADKYLRSLVGRVKAELPDVLFMEQEIGRFRMLGVQLGGAVCYVRFWDTSVWEPTFLGPRNAGQVLAMLRDNRPIRA